MAYDWDDEMREISGFGGSYEAACRAMVSAAMEWFYRNPDADPRFRGIKNVYGICETNNDDARAMEEAMLDARVVVREDGAEVRVGDDCTGAMFHAAVNHVLSALRMGWPAYVEKMRFLKREETT